LLIWDLDALRDEFVRKELFRSRHEDTGNALDSGAFLAAYLIRKRMVGEGLWSTAEGAEEKNVSNGDADEERLLEFFKILPSYEDLQSHPAFWAEDELKEFFGRLTPSFLLIRGHKLMMSSEYDAFCLASEEFKRNVNMKDYLAMRLNVIARSFGPGRPGPEEEMVGVHGTKTLEEEMALYEDEAGVQLRKGCRAMSPILDMWDHHAKPNVEWRYHPKKKAFIIKVVEKSGIPPMQDIMVSYGKYTDTHLFSKFGFVNGDGSGYTEASIAIMHPMLDIGMGQQFSYLIEQDGEMNPSLHHRESQKRAMLNYIRYDDGYEECITKESNPEGYQLKLLKLRHLQKIANNHDRWAFRIAPRDIESKPSISSDVPIASTAPFFDPKKVQFDGSKIIATSRLIALNTEDYDGNAIEALTKGLNDENFIVGKQSDQLEFRALTTLARLTTGALHLYPSNVQSDVSSISSLKYQSKEWIATQVRLGEMQSLEVVRSIASSGSKQMKGRAEKVISPMNPSMKIHRKTCPLESTLQLLEETSFQIDTK